MEVFVKSGSPEKQRTACVVVGVFEPRRLAPAAREIDRATDGYLTKLLRRGDMEGRQGQFLMLHNLPNILPDRVLLVGLGKERDLDDKRYRESVESLVRHLDGTGSMEAVVYFPELHVKGREIEWKVRAATEAGSLAMYRFEEYKSKTDKNTRARPTSHAGRCAASPSACRAAAICARARRLWTKAWPTPTASPTRGTLPISPPMWPPRSIWPIRPRNSPMNGACR